MKVLVIGFGSIGKRHAKNLQSLGHEVIVSEPWGKNRAEAKQMGFKSFASLANALKQKPAAAFICTPTSNHVKPAMKALKAGCHLFVEKPISHTTKGVKELLDLAKKKKKTICVGCNMRYTNGLSKVKEVIDKKTLGKPLCARVEFGYYLPYWHPNNDYRKGYSASKKLGGGVILDAIHEIDYIRWIMGEVKSVYCLAGKISELKMDVEDTAEILLETEKKQFIEVHLDYLQKQYSRNCKIICEKGEVSWDFNQKKTILFFGKGKKKEFKEKKEFGQCYLDEAREFFDKINGKKSTKILDGENALKVLEIALAARKSSEKNKVISL